MSDFQGDVTAWLQATGQLVDQAGDTGPVATAASMFGPVQKWGLREDAVDHVPEFPLPEYRAPEHGRDELAALMRRHRKTDYLICECGETYEGTHVEHQADVILAAGWRAP